jgi:hypothetical protein
MGKILFIITVLFSLTGCGDSFDAAYDAFRSPLNSVPSVSVETIPGWQTSPVNITGSASDSDNDTLTCRWSEVTSYGVTFTTPESYSTGVAFTGNTNGDVAVTAVIRLTVSDGEDESSRDMNLQIYRNDVIFVTPAGTGSGNHPESPLGSIPAAISYANNNSKCIVAIAAGIYEIASGSSGIVMTEGVSLYGGYSPSNWSRSLATNESLIRDRNTYTTANSDSVPNGVIISNDSDITTKATIINGLTIEFGRGSFLSGISCYDSSGLSIKNCIIRSRTDSIVPNGTQVFGIYLNNCGEVIIEGCTITLRDAEHATTDVHMAGIMLVRGGNVLINRNIIYPGRTTTSGAVGNYTYGINTNSIDINPTTLTITNNIISSGISEKNPANSYSTGINLVTAANYIYKIMNNTICAISPYSITSSCIRLSTSAGTETIENNILMQFGITSSYCIYMNSTHSPDSLRNNLFFISTADTFNAFVYSGQPGGPTYIKDLTTTITPMGSNLISLGNITENLPNYLVDYDGPDNDILTLSDNNWHIVKNIHTPMNLLYGGIDLTASISYDFDGNSRTNLNALKATNANAGGFTIGAFEVD